MLHKRRVRIKGQVRIPGPKKPTLARTGNVQELVTKASLAMADLVGSAIIASGVAERMSEFLNAEFLATPLPDGLANIQSIPRSNRIGLNSPVQAMDAGLTNIAPDPVGESVLTTDKLREMMQAIRRNMPTQHSHIVVYGAPRHGKTNTVVQALEAAEQRMLGHKPEYLAFDIETSLGIPVPPVDHNFAGIRLRESPYIPEGAIIGIDMGVGEFNAISIMRNHEVIWSGIAAPAEVEPLKPLKPAKQTKGRPKHIDPRPRSRGPRW